MVGVVAPGMPAGGGGQGRKGVRVPPRWKEEAMQLGVGGSMNCWGERECETGPRSGRERAGASEAVGEREEGSASEGGWRACMHFFSTPRVLIPESFKMAAGAESANDCLNR